ncbi:MAG: SEC-C metal-binding domain-containing protein, partial [Chloroflexota bacterium]
VDILLGGNPEGTAREKLRKAGVDFATMTPEQWQTAYNEAKIQCEDERQKVLAQGGLFVLGTERHEARRIDNQLRGRCGRQGDPGESRFYLSLEDDLMKRFGGDRVKGFMNWANMPEDEAIEHRMISNSIGQAQVRVEGYNFDMRKRVLEYDDVVNKQREVIYAQRRDVLMRDDMREDYTKILENAVIALVDEYTPDNVSPDEWDLEGLYRRALAIFPVPEHINPDTMAGKEVEEIEEMLLSAINEAYDRKETELGGEMMPKVEKWAMLRAVDQHWQRHLTDLDVLREGIGLMSVAQRDPLVEYKRQSYSMWQGMMDEIKTQAAYQLLTVHVAPRPQLMRRPQPIQLNMNKPLINMQQMTTNAGASGASEARQEPVRAQIKLGRNDPCWCGSGKKYKNCHLKEDQAKVK